jgi:hypothetical protein
MDCPIHSEADRDLCDMHCPEPGWTCYKHDDCTDAESCSEQSYADWQASHDTTSCGGMQNGCSACAHIW